MSAMGVTLRDGWGPISGRGAGVTAAQMPKYSTPSTLVVHAACRHSVARSVSREFGRSSPICARYHHRLISQLSLGRTEKLERRSGVTDAPGGRIVVRRSEVAP